MFKAPAKGFKVLRAIVIALFSVASMAFVAAVVHILATTLPEAWSNYPVLSLRFMALWLDFWFEMAFSSQAGLILYISLIGALILFFPLLGTTDRIEEAEKEAKHQAALLALKS